MVFLIQRSQNKDSIAIHLKLNELIAASELASNRMVSVEDISEDELRILRRFYKELSELTKTEVSLHESHSIDEVISHHKRKSKKQDSGNILKKASRNETN
jgi:low affinity Fe/Cu permease